MPFNAWKVVINTIDVVEAQELKDIMKSYITFHVWHKGHGMYFCLTIVSGDEPG